MIILLLLLFVSLAQITQAQSIIPKYGSVEGYVKDLEGNSIPYAIVYLKNTKYSTTTDAIGHYTLKEIPSGSYVLCVKFMGYYQQKKKIVVDPSRRLNIDFSLEENITYLDEIVIEPTSDSELKKMSAESVTIVEAEKFQNSTMNSTDLLDAVAGVRVRQQGGLGSEVNLSIQGISGKQIKFFMDGIPLDVFGQGLGINVIPVNVMKRIEIHKGYVPVEFGGDALGGVVNILTKENRDTYLDASYSIGSFNTHKVHANTQYFWDEQNVYVGFSGFYNHSDNNYPVEVKITNAQGNPEVKRVRRFHDAYTNHVGRIETGILKRTWADELSIQLNYAGFSDEKQHGATMEAPFGQVSTSEKAYGTSLTYKKLLAKQNVSVDFFGAYNRMNRSFTDTSSNIYNWYGEVIGERSFFGETSFSGNLLDLSTNYFLNRLHLNYYVDEHTTLKANLLTSVLERTGTDPVAAQYYKKDIFANPTRLRKYIAAIALEKSWINDKLSSITSVKYFNYYSLGSNLAVEASSVSNTSRRIGYGQTFRYTFSDKLLTKLSYERTTRLPDETELFGIGNLILPNPTLEPENSHNLNAGILYQSQKPQKFSAEVNIFYRLVDDIIYQRLITTVSTQHQNLLSAQVSGVEGEISYIPIRGLSLRMNTSYQDLRNRRETENLDSRYINARLPNIPYLFGNADIRYERANLIKSNDRLQVWWGFNYVHWFYLNWSVDGRNDSKLTIPTQYLQNAGVSYDFLKNKLTGSFEVYNLFDQKAFDNYSVQKPGRFYALKIRTLLQTK